jgi:hypothetical protein
MTKNKSFSGTESVAGKASHLAFFAPREGLFLMWQFFPSFNQKTKSDKRQTLVYKNAI